MAILTDTEIALDPDLRDQFGKFMRALKTAQQDDPNRWDLGPVLLQQSVLFANLLHKKYGWGSSQEFPQRNTKRPVE